jgi:deazaflavin-dependent oxidoreductase (nitroreductase family)
VTAAQRGPLLRFLWRAHRSWYRLTGGRLGARLLGWDVLYLTTRGRKSGEPRSVMLNYCHEGTALVVVGSNAGGDRDPLWWQNLKAHPDAEVRTGTKRFAVHAREAAGTERQLLWDRVIARDPAYAEYEQRTKRRIPVVVLERRD